MPLAPRAQLWANLAAMLERLDDEWTNSLKVSVRSRTVCQTSSVRVAVRAPVAPCPAVRL